MKRILKGKHYFRIMSVLVVMVLMFSTVTVMAEQASTGEGGAAAPEASQPMVASTEPKSEAVSQPMFRMPRIDVYNFKGDPVHVMLAYGSGLDGDNVEIPHGGMPNIMVAWSEVQLTTVRVVDFAFTAEMTPPFWYKSPFYQEDFKNFRIRCKADDEGKLTVEKISGEVTFEYDADSNVISLYPVSKSLSLDVPQVVNSDCDRMDAHGVGSVFRPHYYSFTPEKSGNYNFFSSDLEKTVNPTGVIMDSKGQVLITDDNSGENGNFLISKFHLQAGETYYLGTAREDTDTSGDYKINITKEPDPKPMEIGNKSEGYTDLKVKKKWDDKKKDHKPVTVTISPANTDVKELTLSKDNNWEAVFENLPLYDEQGKEIKYTVKEKESGDCVATYEKTKEISRETYWVMVNAPEQLEPGRKYVIAAQDWGQAMYFNNPHTYYFMKDSDNGPEGNIGMHRIENTDTLFTGPKTGNGTEPLVLGGKSYDEYFNNENPIVKNITAGETWILGTEADGYVLRNEGLSQLLTLKGDNHWWNQWNPHQYSFINSNEDGWHPDINVNYSHVLEISPAADGMARIASTQYWGNNRYEKQYLYLNLTADAQVTGATGEYNFAGQFKFFTPITKVEQSITITNTTADVEKPNKKVPPEPKTGDNNNLKNLILVLSISSALCAGTIILGRKGKKHS